MHFSAFSELSNDSLVIPAAAAIYHISNRLPEAQKEIYDYFCCSDNIRIDIAAFVTV